MNPMSDQRSPWSLRHAVLPASIFFFVTLASLIAAYALWNSAISRDRARFDAESRIASVAISERMERQVALLSGAAGLFAAGVDVPERGFEAYVDSIGLATRYPGVLGLGYAARIEGPAERDAFVAAVRRTAASAYRIWPAGDRAFYHPIVYLAPSDRRNRAAIGYDMYSEPVRRAAMLRAATEGVPAVTGRVQLIQETEAVKQPGFILYMPVYEGGRIPIGASQRIQRLNGYVYSPLRAHDFGNAVFVEDEIRSVEVAIYDETVAPANLLYSTGPVSRADKRFYAETTVRIAGRPWIIATAPNDSFARGSQRSLAWWTAISGVLTALFLALAAWLQARASLATERARAELRQLNDTLEARVDERTAEVSAAYEGLRKEIERRQGAEDQVRQMQKMEAVGQLTGGIAHDFNNMLAIIIGSLDMAKRRLTDSVRVSRLIDNAMEGATRAATLTQRLLAFSRRQPLQPEPVDINRLVAGMSELVRRTIGESVMLETHLTAGTWGTLVDIGQLENALLNLCVNARDAMPDGGSLTIETANRHLDAAYVENIPSAKTGDYVMIAVTDSGEGMSADVLAKAFDPFFTTKEVGKGTGLGLSQVFGFIQQSGGHVEIDSVVGRGTTVRIFLARLDIGLADDATEVPQTGKRLPRGDAGEIILVVEDEQQVRLMSVEALRDLGYTVLHAEGGPEALSKIADYPGIRLLFTDVVMPEMNGRELADAALKLSPDLKLLFTTGYTADAIVKDGQIDVGVEFMAKPFTFEQLALKVRSVLDAKGNG